MSFTNEKKSCAMCDKCKELEKQVVRLKKERRAADRARRVAQLEYQEMCDLAETLIEYQALENKNNGRDKLSTQ